ncbi:unnamed protein product [Polarella glacialis]|uniref:Uncharacterized protein n=1 Tax=Polarella glacialis TaxID=89957 RepID=A0A813J8D1_POLGL|nr:unnamed protein product [Polarella glacialis]
MLGASDVRPDALSLAQRQPLSSCAAINKAQLNLRLFCNRSGMFEREADHSLGTDLLALHTKLYPLLAKMAQHCYEFRELGNLPSSLFDNPNDQGLAEEEQNWSGVVKELAAGRLLLPFQPLFGAARSRGWAKQSLHNVCGSFFGNRTICLNTFKQLLFGSLFSAKPLFKHVSTTVVVSSPGEEGADAPSALCVPGRLGEASDTLQPASGLLGESET